MIRFCAQCGSPTTVSELAGEQRTVCSNPDCSHIAWENPIPVAAGLIELDGLYVLAQNKQWPQGIYSMITGYVEKTELPAETIRRETEEELGLIATTHSLIGHYMFKEKNQLIIAYHVIADGQISLGSELRAIKSVTKDQLLGSINKNLYVTRNVISDFLKHNAS